MEALKSRKLWIAVIAGLAVVLNGPLRLGLTEPTMATLVALVVAYYTVNIADKAVSK